MQGASSGFIDRGGGAQRAGLPKPQRCWAARSSCSRAVGPRPSCGKEEAAGFWAQKGRFWVNGVLAAGGGQSSVPPPQRPVPTLTAYL